MNRIDGLHPDAPALAAWGSFPVGVETLQMVNPGQADVLGLGAKGAGMDRRLTVECWYPAASGVEPGCDYRTLLRDGHRDLTLFGRACRDAPPLQQAFPLVILSHGYPGNRMLLAHFGEKLASHGYVVASLDHPESTYDDKAALSSTLVHRPGDVQAVHRVLGQHRALTDYAILGYSMGGYGALIAGGAAIAPAALGLEIAPKTRAHWDFALDPCVDPGLKAIVPIGPWGRQIGLWDAKGLARLQVPMLLMAGSCDTISGYDDGMRLIFDEAVSIPRHLLTFHGAGHNAAAPYPAPQEAFEPSLHLDFLPAEHYADPVWETLRMNNIAQHFTVAFLDLHLKGDGSRHAYLSSDWVGFSRGAASGLRFESKAPGI